MIGPDEKCPVEDCEGILGEQILPSENCSCHISPPCGACMNAPYECDTCHEQFYPEDEEDG